MENPKLKVVPTLPDSLVSKIICTAQVMIRSDRSIRVLSLFTASEQTPREGMGTRAFGTLGMAHANVCINTYEMIACKTINVRLRLSELEHAI